MGATQEERACGKVYGKGGECGDTLGGVEGVLGKVRWEGFYGGGGAPGEEGGTREEGFCNLVPLQLKLFIT